MPDQSQRIHRIVVLGGGSAGFLSALALKARMPDLAVMVVRSKEIGIIGVGEGSTVALTNMLHDYLRVNLAKLHEIAKPTWKMGLKFIWGKRPHFYYTFSAQQMNSIIHPLPKAIGYYCNGDMDTAEPMMAMMAQNRVFDRDENGMPVMHDSIAYHVENHFFVDFLERAATEAGIEILEDTVAHVQPSEQGIGALIFKSGRAVNADLYIDCSGFASLLLGKTLGEPFVPFKSSLFCDRAIVGGWTRQADEPIQPFTTCGTMNSGWLWQIEHEHRINRGYVYCSAFITDEQAEQELRAISPRLDKTRVVKFITGRYERAWVKNVVAIGNANGFVEPLEATALGVISMQSRLLADTLAASDRQIRFWDVTGFNRHHRRYWDSIRRFIAIHYKFNDRIDTPFWRACREKTDLAGAEEIAAYYQESGPGTYWAPTIMDSLDPFGMGGYVTLLLGQSVPYRHAHQPNQAELAAVEAIREKNRQRAANAMTTEEVLAAIRSPEWNWKSSMKREGSE